MKNKYLCINGYFPVNLKNVKEYPLEGEIYTLDFRRTEPNGKVGLILKELNNPYFFSWQWGEMVLPSFSEDRFISILSEEKEEKKLEKLENYIW